jgi:hypothetical protein
LADRLESGWLVAVMPIIRAVLEYHLIQDLGAIVGEFLTGLKSKSRSGVDVDLDFASGLARAGPPVAADGVANMEID